MNPEFCFKLGQLLGALDDFLVRVEENEISKSEIDRIATLIQDTKKKFFEANKEGVA